MVEMEKEGYKTWNWKLIVRVTNVIGMIGAIFCAFYSYATEKIQVKSIFINLYLIIFPAAILLAEFSHKYVQQYFSFLLSFSGRAMMLLFIASLLLVYTTTQNIIFSVFVFIDFAMHCSLLCCIRPPFIEEEKKKFREQAKAQAESGRSTVTKAAAAGVMEAGQEEAVEQGMPSWAVGTSDNTPVPSSQMDDGAAAPSTTNTNYTDTAPLASGGGTMGDMADSDTPSWAVGIEDDSQPGGTGANPFA